MGRLGAAAVLCLGALGLSACVSFEANEPVQPQRVAAAPEETTGTASGSGSASVAPTSPSKPWSAPTTMTVAPTQPTLPTTDERYGSDVGAPTGWDMAPTWDQHLTREVSCHSAGVDLNEDYEVYLVNGPCDIVTISASNTTVMIPGEARHVYIMTDNVSVALSNTRQLTIEGKQAVVAYEKAKPKISAKRDDSQISNEPLMPLQ